MTSVSRRACTEVILSEFGLFDIQSLCAGSRVRAFKKWMHSTSSTMGDLIHSRFTGRGKQPRNTRTWALRTHLWLIKREKLIDAVLARFQNGRTSHPPPEGFGRVIAAWLFRDKIERKARGKRAPQSLLSYERWQFVRTRKYIKFAVNWPQWTRGVSLLLRARLGAYNTGYFLACSRILPPDFFQECPFCNLDVPDNIVHTLLECSAWSAARLDWLSGMIEHIRALTPCTNSELAILILGGTCSKGYIRDWDGASHLPDPGCDVDPFELDFDIFDDDDGDAAPDLQTRGRDNSDDDNGDDDDDGNDDDDNDSNYDYNNDGDDDARMSDDGQVRGNTNHEGGSESSGPDGKLRAVPAFLRVSAFLQTIDAARHRRVRSLSQRAEADPGMANRYANDEWDDTSSSVAPSDDTVGF
jgi:hypothetical protein